MTEQQPVQSQPTYLEPWQDPTWQWWAKDPAGHWHPVPVPRQKRANDNSYTGWYVASILLIILAVIFALNNFFLSGLALLAVGAAIVTAIIGACAGIRAAIQERG